MQDAYEIYENNIVVGKVCLQKEGLYCRLKAICHVPVSKIRLIMQVDMTNTDLGIFVPDNGAMVLNKRIPLKSLGESAPLFYIQRGEGGDNTIILDPNTQIHYLEKLNNARLVYKGETPLLQFNG